MNQIGTIGLVLSSIGLVCLVISGLGYRLGFWAYKTGITLVKSAGYLSVAAVVMCLVSLGLWYWEIIPQDRNRALIGFIVGVCVLGITLKWKFSLHSLPYIHDISTDTENPPQFVNVLALRAGAENPAEYGGPELARQQKLAYPDLKPGTVNAPPTEIFSRAVQAARDMGWEIVDSDLTALRIEATDTTFWFGFKDDIVVRLTPTSTGSRIDVRSVSRVGKSDLGTNARRIHAYLEQMKSEKIS